MIRNIRMYPNLRIILMKTQKSKLKTQSSNLKLKSSVIASAEASARSNLKNKFFRRRRIPAYRQAGSLGGDF